MVCLILDLLFLRRCAGINIANSYFLGGVTIALRSVNGSRNKVDDLNKTVI